MCKCVDIFGGWWKELLYMNSLSLSLVIFFGMGYFFLTRFVGVWRNFFKYASFLFFFSTCFVGMWHTFFGYASFIYFCIAHTFFMITLERDSHGTTWSFICGWMDGCTCYLPSVEVWHVSGCVRDLDHGRMK